MHWGNLQEHYLSCFDLPIVPALQTTSTPALPFHGMSDFIIVISVVTDAFSVLYPDGREGKPPFEGLAGHLKQEGDPGVHPGLADEVLYHANASGYPRRRGKTSLEIGISEKSCLLWMDGWMDGL